MAASCATTMFVIGNVVSCIENTLHFLAEKGVLANGVYCHHCSSWMSITLNNELRDKYRWYCRVCNKKVSLRIKSFWYGQTSRLQTLLMMLYLFAVGIAPATALRLMHGQISKPMLLRWYQYYKDLMSTYLVNNPIRLGGVGKFVEVDESKFGHKRKYNRGRCVGDHPWIVGIIERGSKKVTLLKVLNRKATTLVSEIERVVEPGTTIITDKWAGYSSLSQRGYTHLTVNHSENFVDPNTGAHTQNIEGFWAHSKQFLKAMHGSQNLPNHLDETIFRWNYKDSDMFQVLLDLIGLYYPAMTEVLPKPVMAGKPPLVFRV